MRLLKNVSSQQRLINKLEAELKVKDDKIAELQTRLNKQQKAYKSNFCIVCKHFIGLYDSIGICELYDKAPCVDFKFSGSPRNLDNMTKI